MTEGNRMGDDPVDDEGPERADGPADDERHDGSVTDGSPGDGSVGDGAPEGKALDEDHDLEGSVPGPLVEERPMAEHRMGDLPENVTTVYLGNYSAETANLIAAELERLDVVWWYKPPGFLSSLWEHGVRMFVDKRRLKEAKDIAKRVSADREAKGWPPLE